jgi:hypothetical protein
MSRLLGVGGIAGLLLILTLLNSSRDGIAVGGVCAGVVLNGAGALESSAFVHECGAVDGEGLGAGALDDGWCGATKVSGESLDVGAGRSGGSGASTGVGTGTGVCIGICTLTLEEGWDGIALGIASGIASCLLLLALSGASRKLARVNSIEAGVVLNIARTLNCCADVDKGVTVDSEWAVTGSLGDRWCCSSNRTIESLDICAW